MTDRNTDISAVSPASSTRAATPCGDVLGTRLENEAVLLHLGTKRYYRLNTTGTVIWTGVEEGLSRAEIVDRLCSEFDVDAGEANRAATALLADLAANELIVLSSAA